MVGASVASNLSDVRKKISTSAQKAGRQAKDICLIGVSKKKSSTLIRESFQAGLRDVGENYVQELLQKKDELKDCNDLRWHFIGNLQRNKVKQIVGQVDFIHSVDRVELAQEISKVASEKKIDQKILIQINLGNEDTKGGVEPEQITKFHSEISKLPHLQIVGLMSLPPLVDETKTRKFFHQLNELKNKIKVQEVSMGTSADYELAVEEGATMVRVGTSIFGERT